jgi:hypothetical protein
VTDNYQKFEVSLLENVKKIRDGSVLLKKPSEENLNEIFEKKVKDNFKIDSKCESEAQKLFEMISQKKEYFKKKHLSLFNQFVIECSDNKISSNKSFVMLQRLEKAIAISSKIHFNDFVKFVCKPDPSFALKQDSKDLLKNRSSVNID